MSNIVEGVEGVIAFVVSGFILILMGSAVESSSVLYNLSTFGLFMILLGAVLAVGIVATIIGK
ncbi:hypothetical protein G9C85_11260 [Halorubellus sp. JP-L1]|uniref:hypothetical protein n=1 Tax=Halorubellus sp. JP-L1 TaxID=2715753 RepID=UPI0014096D96|nr:hypothetical protein [Halorubellus sp. JP-L1]NHN42199.1 hypothetical protein [Halorubellus sp. JP-L1]